MLQGSSDKTNRVDLLKQIEEQRKQIVSYERKLKDVVRAYKGLNAEKDALQAIVEALSSRDPASKNAKPSANVSSSDESFQRTEEMAQNEGTESDTAEQPSDNDKLEMLKRSIVTLTNEKNRREAAFQADKRALLAENEALKERIEKSANETEAQAEKLEQHMKVLRAKVKRIEEDRERELSDHGSVLAEMQQRYAKEHATCEQLERQIAELYKKLRHHEEYPAEMETKLCNLNSELKAANEEASFWKKKAVKIPTVQMLESELKNLKEESQRELNELKSRINSTDNPEREARLHELEERLHNMTAKLAKGERIRLELQQKVEDLQARNNHLQVENDDLSQELGARRLLSDDSGNIESVRERFIEFAEKLRAADCNVNFHELLKLEQPSKEQKEQYMQLKDDFERYKLKAQAILKCRNLPEGSLDGHSNLPLVSSLASINQCSSCASSDVELTHMRSVIASLHEKLHKLEIDHEIAKKDHEKQCARLHTTIADMQSSQVNATNELRHQMQQKVTEVEDEMQKQRARTLQVLAEKQKELEVTRTILVSIRGQQINATDPVDPTQANMISDCPQSRCLRKSSSKDAVQLNDDENHKSSAVLSASAAQSVSLAPVSNSTLSRNIFYEQQLAKREKELNDLRIALETSESNMRAIQQSSLTKDLQHYEIIEKLKDEIRILEGKVNFYSGDANVEYLRNVFVQLLHCDSSSGRRHILKAIGTVLKLSNNEMKSLDKHSFC